jgi:hypothetical protein
MPKKWLLIVGFYLSVFLVAEIRKQIKLEKKHPIGRRYRVVSSGFSSKKISSNPKISKPKSNSKIPALVYFDSLLRVNIIDDLVLCA